MGTAPLIVSIIAVVVSGSLSAAALLYARRADARSKAADERDRKRHERELAADIDLEPFDVYERERDRVYHMMRVRNLGSATATDVLVTIADGAESVGFPSWLEFRAQS